VDAYNALGTAYLAAGKTNEAIQAFQQALVKSPHHWYAQSALDRITAAAAH